MASKKGTWLLSMICMANLVSSNNNISSREQYFRLSRLHHIMKLRLIC